MTFADQSFQLVFSLLKNEYSNKTVEHLIHTDRIDSSRWFLVIRKWDEKYNENQDIASLT